MSARSLGAGRRPQEAPIGEQGMREETGTGARRSWPMDMALLWAAGAGSRWDRRGPAGTGGVLPGRAGSCRDSLGEARSMHGNCPSRGAKCWAVRPLHPVPRPRGGGNSNSFPSRWPSGKALRRDTGHRRCWREEALVAVLEWGAAEEIWRGSPRASATASSAKCFHFC